MNNYETIIRRIMDKREAYMTSNNIASPHSAGRTGEWVNSFEKFIHKEYKQEIKKLINENKRLKKINVSSDLIRLHSGNKKKKKTLKGRKKTLKITQHIT